MEILVTGGTGVVGSPTIAALVRREHRVRLYSRHASESKRLWPHHVSTVDGDIEDEEALTRTMAGADAVIHLAGIVSERDGKTFETVNVEGTRHALRAATRAHVKRFVYMSSLGAERGQSPYHQSKRMAEELTRGFEGEWVVLRPGNVYGPGDEVISLLLKIIRVSPVVPAIDGGDHRFQPIWVEDLAEATAEAVTRADVVQRSLDLAGPDLTSMNDLIDRFRSLTGRSPVRVPVPGFLSVLGARAAGLLGMNVPLDRGQVQMLEEGNLIAEPADNALVSVFAIKPTPLDEGLRRLADSLPEQPLDSGVGSMVRRHVWADIVESQLDAEALFERFRARFGEITPWHVEVGAEPGTPVDPRLGATLTMHLPLRGNVQVRVVELTKSYLTLATIDGHPLAGLVRFRLEPLGERRIRFHVEVHDRPGNIADWLVMSTVGGTIQVATWRSTVEHLVKESGGSAPDGVHDESENLHGEEAAQVESWARGLIEARKRSLHEAGLSEATSPDKSRAQQAPASVRAETRS
ncbi:MAG TPA: NAD-dependent epimerase/dehydratase family protein [Polyangiaceae bacterium]|nr:NAD-dependent epimerase/dehydratase family protein [Polyangiaceae bacterium]